VAEKPRGERAVDRAAGGVVFRRGPAGAIEIVIAEQRDWRTGERSVRLPKGHEDPGETPEQTALREVREEAGVEARIVASLGEVSYVFFHPKRGLEVDKRVRFFLMEHRSGEPAATDSEMERVFWCEIGEAAARLRFETERDVVARAREALERL
jgi:8-oxo-dGTP pyrophosphatase MutT (NUDIX family)